MNVTFLAGYFTPEKSADTHLNDDLVRDFAEYGATVNVIVPFPSRGLDDKQIEEYELLREEKIGENLTIHRVGKKTTYKKGLIARGCSFLAKTFTLYQASKKYSTDCYFVVSTPPFLGYFVKRLARRAPVVYKLQDVFPDNLIEIKGWSEKNIIVKILRKMERKVYQAASKILVCSENVKQTIMSRGVEEEKIKVVHDWVDENVCTPVEKNANSLFDEFGIDRNRFTFAYAGNIGHMQNLNTILDAAKILKSKGSDAQIVIIGDGAWKSKMDERIDGEGITNIKRIPMQPLDRVSMVYSMGDVGLVSLKPGVSKTALPSKTWSIMSAARPVICEIDNDCELVSIIEKNSCGYSVAPGDASGMADIMLEMCSMSKEALCCMGKSCRSYITNELNRKKTTKICFDEIVELVKGEEPNVTF